MATEIFSPSEENKKTRKQENSELIKYKKLLKKYPKSKAIADKIEQIEANSIPSLGKATKERFTTLSFEVTKTQEDRLIDKYKERLKDPKFKNQTQWLRNKILEIQINREPPKRKKTKLWGEEKWSQPKNETNLMGSHHFHEYATNESHIISGKKITDKNGNYWFSGTIDRNSYGNSEKIITKGKNVTWKNGKWEILAGASISLIPNKQALKKGTTYRDSNGKIMKHRELVDILGIFPAIQAEVRYEINKNTHLGLKTAYTPSFETQGWKTPTISQFQLGITHEW